MVSECARIVLIWGLLLFLFELSFLYFLGGREWGRGWGEGMGVFNQTIIPLVVVRYEMTIALAKSVRVSRRVVGSLSSHTQRVLVE